MADPSAGREFNEMRSSITFIDTFRAWYGYRRWFIIGFVAAGLIAFVWAKFVMTRYYKSTGVIYVGRQFLPESWIGLADLQNQFIGGRNEQYQNLVQGLIAEQYLLSEKLLLDVVARLHQESNIDVYNLLDITEKDPIYRDGQLLKMLKESLLEVRQVQNTGIIYINIELPTPQAAQAFASTAIQVLQEYFTSMDFGYVDEAFEIYKRGLVEAEEATSETARQLELLERGFGFDRSNMIEGRRGVLEETLTLQAEKLAELRDKVTKLQLAVSPEAKEAAQAVRVVDAPNLPLKKSRPQTILLTVMVVGLYTFVFLLGLVLIAMVQAGRERAWGAGAAAQR